MRMSGHAKHHFVEGDDGSGLCINRHTGTTQSIAFVFRVSRDGCLTKIVK